MADRGLSDNELSRQLRARGFRISQSTISRIAGGRTASATYRTLKPIADFFRVTTEQLRGEKSATKASEAQPPYLDLTPEAVEMARMWLRLPEFKRRGYVQAIMTDAAVLEVFPELERAMRAAAVAADPDYHKMTSGFERARNQLERQLGLKFSDS